MTKTTLSEEREFGAELFLLLQMFDDVNHYTGIVRLTIRNNGDFRT